MLSANCELQTNIKQWIVKIKIDGTSAFGTGFFVARDLICTCSHLFDNETDINKIKVKWAGSEYTIKAKYAITNSSDITFLVVKDAFNSGWLVPDLSNPNFECNFDSRFFMYGYSSNYPEAGEPITLEYSGNHKDNHGNVLQTFKNDKVIAGMSGSPVIDLSTGYTVGIMKLTRDEQATVGGRAIPFWEALLKLYTLFPDLFFSSFEYDNHYLLSSATPDISDYLTCIQNCECIKRNALEYTHNSLIRGTDLDKLLQVAPYLDTLLKCSLPSKTDEKILLALFLKNNSEETQKDNILNAYISLLENSSSVSSEDVKKIKNYCFDGIISLNNTIKAKVHQNKKDMLRMPIAGSISLRLEQLIDHDFPILTPFECKNTHLNSKDIVSVIIDKLAEQINFTIISKPGLGKSTLAKLVYLKLTEMREDDLTNLLPVYIDLHNERREVNQFGTFEWVEKKIKQIYGETIFSQAYLDKDYSNVVFILDALDEYMNTQNSKEERDKFFGSYLFTKINHFIITCRNNYFYNHVREESFVKTSEIVKLEKWSPKAKADYIKNYLSCLQKCVSIWGRIGDIQKKLATSPIREITSTPLYLNMAIEVYAQAINENKNISMQNLVSLYDHFSDRWLKIEADKAPKEYDSIQALVGNVGEFKLILSSLFSQIYMNNSDNHFRTHSTSLITDYLTNFENHPVIGYRLKNCDLDLLGKYILERTFIINNETLQFIHNSFSDYFTSYYMYTLLTTQNSDAGFLSEIFSKMISPEITEFIKGHFAKNKLSNTNKRIIFRNCKDCIANHNSNDSVGYRSKIIKEQLLFILGMIHFPEIKNFLNDYLQIEKDVWIRRSIIIALAYEGDTSAMDKYIEQLYQERVNGDNCIENSVNLGFSLSFYGDQEFDEEAPAHDQQGNVCKNTITHLIYQLSSEEERPCWRLNMYTIVDLAHRSYSSQDYRKTITQFEKRINQTLNRIEKENAKRGIEIWPEINKLRQITNEIVAKNKYRN